MQRVLVDGWTPEEAGAPFGIDGRSVARWVAAYQNHGMAALRGEAALRARAAALDRLRSGMVRGSVPRRRETACCPPGRPSRRTDPALELAARA